MSQIENKNIARALDNVRRLPSLPSLVLEILDSFNDEQVDIPTLAAKIGHDQSLVARVMRVANSAFFGFSGQIGTISEAIAVLGFNNLRGLVTAAAVINAFPRGGDHFDWNAFWRHSIAVAVCARVLAKHSGLNMETAFTAGVLHDIGRLVMAMYFPQQLAQAGHIEDGSPMELLQSERAALGFDHAELGGELASRWNFPSAIRDAIALHHAPAGTGAGKTLTDVVFVANLFAHALEGGGIGLDQSTPLAKATFARLALDVNALPGLADEAQRLFDNSILLVGD